ncbi:GNAT family N-acetyltransferase [Shewanella waksmanii]|uniref:GNAT family N-acetyltransferase n=1 Tax=Shewanella waksmanii TaxID=213783 RepID=UPI00373510F2
MNTDATLYFRQLEEADALLLHDLDQDPEVMRFITGGKTTSLEEIQEIMIPRMMSFTDVIKGWGLWGVFSSQHKSRDSFLGWILIRPMGFFTNQPKFNDLEIGWRFKRETWGRGIATRSAKYVLKQCQQLGEFNYISAIAEPGNTASINVMEKLGLSFIKCDYEKGLFDNEPVKIVLHRKAL